MAASAWVPRSSHRLVYTGCASVGALLVVLVFLSATGFPTPWLIAVLGSIVSVALMTVLADLRRRHALLHQELAKSRRAIALMAGEPGSLTKSRHELQGLATKATAITAALGALDKRAKDIQFAVNAHRADIGWIELAKHLALEPQFADGDVDPWAVVEVRKKLDELPPGATVVVLGGRFTALLCALVGPADTTVIMLTEDPATKEAVNAEVRRRSLESRVEVRLAELEYVVCGNVAGYTYSSQALTGVSDAPVVVIAGPSWALGPGARNAVLACVVPSMARQCRVVASDSHHPDFLAMLDAWRSLVDGASVRKSSARGLDIAFDRMAT